MVLTCKNSHLCLLQWFIGGNHGRNVDMICQIQNHFYSFKKWTRLYFKKLEYIYPYARRVRSCIVLNVLNSHSLQWEMMALGN